MEQAADFSALLRPGIYFLGHLGRIVFIGKAKVPLVRIAAHRNLARIPPKAWVPIKGIVFDKVSVQSVHPDRIDDELAAAIARYRPRLNEPTIIAFPEGPRIERRI